VKKPLFGSGRGSKFRHTPFVYYLSQKSLGLHFDICRFPYYNVRSTKINTMATATVTSKGQITIPSQVRNALGLAAGDRVEFVEQGNGQFAIVAATRSVQELKGLFQGKRSKPVSIEEMNAAIAKRASRSG